ncbi:hypothetical protein [Pyxidicoccus trucidator]|uniref:hypothetical protein n=1 Tax=Pyxidicoccus trucidator TaxID=2709662 RepID=UPI0013DC56F2|nr:hypothetical protein [Pyxidicoccus trucidator]
MKHISTYVRLPPGRPAAGVVRELLDLVFNQYRWFQPVSYGRFGDEARLVPGRSDYRDVLACYDEYPKITISARPEEDYLMLFPSTRDEYPFVGKLIWAAPLAEAENANWRNAHLRQVMEVMRLLDSPLAYACSDEDKSRKSERVIPSPDGVGSEQAFTVRDPSEGLAGLYWRNFFGPPFVRMFGERLLSLPPDTRQELGDGLVLVQPYALPTQAMTPEGDAAEERLITVLGPECFYDHQQHRKPTRVPELTPPTK